MQSFAPDVVYDDTQRKGESRTILDSAGGCRHWSIMRIADTLHPVNAILRVEDCPFH